MSRIFAFVGDLSAVYRFIIFSIMSNFARLTMDRVLLNIIRQRTIHRSNFSSLSSMNGVVGKVPLSGKLVQKSRVCICGNISVRFSSGVSLLPESVVTFNPKNVEIQQPAIQPLVEGEKGTVLDLSNFLNQPEPTPEQLELIAKTFADVTCHDLSIWWWAPTGGVFYLLNYLHGFVPWYAAIAIMTIAFRILVTPIAIQAQKNAAIQSRYLPMLTDAQERYSEASKTGNKYDLLLASNDLNIAMKKSNPSMLKTMGMPLVQAPIFASTFLVLRKMTKYPVESLKDGGTLWFTDLTVPDPYFLLPIITATTMHFVIKKGIDTGANINMMNPWLRNGLLYGAPVAIIGITYSFPAALLCYWATTNLVSLIQTWTFSIPKVRTFLNIPQKKEWKPEELRRKPSKPKRPSKGLIGDAKDLVQGIKDKYTDMRTASKIQNYRALQDEAFEQAGRGPIPQTFKYDPTKPAPKNK